MNDDGRSAASGALQRVETMPTQRLIRLLTILVQTSRIHAVHCVTQIPIPTRGGRFIFWRLVQCSRADAFVTHLICRVAPPAFDPAFGAWARVLPAHRGLVSLVNAVRGEREAARERCPPLRVSGPQPEMHTGATRVRVSTARASSHALSTPAQSTLAAPNAFASHGPTPPNVGTNAQDADRRAYSCVCIARLPPCRYDRAGQQRSPEIGARPRSSAISNARAGASPLPLNLISSQLVASPSFAKRPFCRALRASLRVNTLRLHNERK